MKKLLILAPLLLLTACGNNSGKDAAALEAAAAQTMAEKPKCKQGPFKNKHELAKLLTEQVYGKPKQVALDMFGRPGIVTDLSGGQQAWSYGIAEANIYCSEPDEITGKETAIGFTIYMLSDGTVEVKSEPLTNIMAVNYDGATVAKP